MRNTWAQRLACLIAGAAFGCSASLWAASPQASSMDALYRKLEILAEVFAQIEGHYVDAVSPTELIGGAIRGALSTLDPHSTFYSPEAYRSLIDSTEGEYAGVGLEIDVRDDAYGVLAVYEDSPAARAGILPGETLLAVGERDALEMDVDQLEEALRGQVGSQVTLRVRRDAKAKPRDCTVVRGWVRVAPLASRPLDHGALYVQVKTFSRRVASDLRALLERQAPAGGLVLDLRGNPGGLFDEAVEMCDLFLADGPIVSAVGRGGALLEERQARAPGTQPPFKLAVLIDGGSASAAEIVAGALQDRGRARLFGARSYGKGSVQSILDLTDGSGLKLTIARYLTPSGRQIDGHGIEPDERWETPAEGISDGALAAAVTYLTRP